MSFLLLALWRRNGAAFLPAQNYHNTQSVIKAIFTSVLTGIEEQIETYFTFLDSDDRLEVSFSILRAMFPGVNFDCVQFEDRQSAVMTIQDIFARRPELDRGSKHLRTTGVSGLATDDHMNPASYVRIDGTSPAREDKS
eukprot:6651277-Prymnesium_polylepis.1